MQKHVLIIGPFSCSRGLRRWGRCGWPQWQPQEHAHPTSDNFAATCHRDSAASRLADLVFSPRDRDPPAGSLLIWNQLSVEVLFEGHRDTLPKSASPTVLRELVKMIGPATGFLLAERFQSTVGARHSGIWLGREGAQDSTYRMASER
jgi:hypothetical protein